MCAFSFIKDWHKLNQVKDNSKKENFTQAEVLEEINTLDSFEWVLNNK